MPEPGHGRNAGGMRRRLVGIPCPAVGTESLVRDLSSLSLGRGKTPVARSDVLPSSSAPPPPKEPISFITPFDMYYYVTMPFSLRNAGATYQRCTTQVLGEHIERTVEAGVDDIKDKSRKASDLIDDLEVGGPPKY